jgi:imidazoleglycerol-phosphate dehydratase/histidinol-phosphatase
MAKKILFLDRDGTIIREPEDEQIDSLEKLEFYPKVFQYLSRIVNELDYGLVMVTNQDGLGTEVYPEETFDLVQEKMLAAFENEGIPFIDILVDRSFPDEQLPTRKPGIGMLEQHLKKDYEWDKCFVIGDRITDMVLARNMNIRGIWINGKNNLGAAETELSREALEKTIALATDHWADIYFFLKTLDREARIKRKTRETDILIDLKLDGTGRSDISTGIDFFDHMLDQLSRHSGADLNIKVKGDLEVDEHHTIEDTAIALGEAFLKALGNKAGIERYGFCLPMDDSLAQVAIDFGGRNWIEWDAEFKREMIGKMPTEMFFHFFKSFSDHAKCNLNIKAEGTNEHHKIEAIFKAWARAIRMAIRKDPDSEELPTTKGVL